MRVFNDMKDFFTDRENKSAVIIIIFVGDAKPEITTAVNPKTLSSTGACDAFVAGALVIARSADQAGDRRKSRPGGEQYRRGRG
jgi:hypothetical protein